LLNKSRAYPEFCVNEEIGPSMMFVDINVENSDFPGRLISGPNSFGSYSPAYSYPSGSGYGWNNNFGGSANYNGGYNYNGGGAMYNSGDASRANGLNYFLVGVATQFYYQYVVE